MVVPCDSLSISICLPLSQTLTRSRLTDFRLMISTGKFHSSIFTFPTTKIVSPHSFFPDQPHTYSSYTCLCFIHHYIHQNVLLLFSAKSLTIELTFKTFYLICSLYDNIQHLTVIFANCYRREHFMYKFLEMLSTQNSNSIKTNYNVHECEQDMIESIFAVLLSSILTVLKSKSYFALCLINE